MGLYFFGDQGLSNMSMPLAEQIEGGGGGDFPPWRFLPVHGYALLLLLWLLLWFLPVVFSNR